MSNKSNGTCAEKELAQILSEKGFWVHRLMDKVNGQPFDIIACRNNKCYAIDCKDCVGDTFVFSRVEDNQRNSMKLWRECRNNCCGFAIRSNGEWYFLDYAHLCFLEKRGDKSVKLERVYTLGETVALWTVPV